MSITQGSLLRRGEKQRAKLNGTADAGAEIEL
jgi:hypothetical protein